MLSTPSFSYYSGLSSKNLSYLVVFQEARSPTRLKCRLSRIESAEV